MSRFILDTNILLGIIRESEYADVVERELGIFDADATSAISIVSKGEIWSLAYQFGWGRRKQDQLRTLLGSIPTVALNDPIVERYAEIDAFSQGAHPERQLGMSARNMGKNDLWIAATASVLGATLVTTDLDFDHLHGEFCAVEWIDPTAA